MTLEEAWEYVDRAHEMEGEQRAEYGSGAVSMGYDPHEWMPAYDGYRTSEDPQYAEAKGIIDAYNALHPAPTLLPVSESDIPF